MSKLQFIVGIHSKSKVGMKMNNNNKTFKNIKERFMLFACRASYENTTIIFYT